MENRVEHLLGQILETKQKLTGKRNDRNSLVLLKLLTRRIQTMGKRHSLVKVVFKSSVNNKKYQVLYTDVTEQEAISLIKVHYTQLAPNYIIAQKLETGKLSDL